MRAAAVYVLVFSSTCVGFAQSLGASPREILNSANTIRQLPPEAQNSSIGVHIRGVVTYYDSVAPNLFVQDATGGIWVDLAKSTAPPPRPGQLLDLTGVVGAGFTPYVAQPVWRVIGTAPLPKAQFLTYEQAATSSFDSQWVEMEGIVRSFVLEAAGHFLVIDVVTPSGSFKVRVPDYRAPHFPADMVDAKVRFKGACGAQFNKRKQLVAIHLMMPSLDDAHIIEPAPAHPFAIATTPVAGVGGFSAQLNEVHRVKVKGIVTARFPGRGLLLMDKTGGLYAETQDGDPVIAGDEVEVIGFPATNNYSMVLKSATIRPTGRHETVAPTPITGHTAIDGEYDSQLVTITGTFQSVNLAANLSRNDAEYSPPGSIALVMQSNDKVNFEAHFAVPAKLKDLPPIGSVLKLTGVCFIKTDGNGNPAAFGLYLRSPDDIEVLSTPPWLGARQAASMVAVLAALIAAVFAWVIVLRKRVRNQTRLIQIRLENEAALEKRYRRMFERNLTGLYTASPGGRILDCNEACAQLLGYGTRESVLENWPDLLAITAQFHQHLHEDAVGGATQILNAEHRFQCPDGSWRWALANVRLVKQTDSATALLEGGLVDITARKTAEEQVKYLAYYDSLTGLPNRSLLKDRLGKALASARRHHEKVAVLFLDLDRFKIINDSMGHSYGDLLLKQVALRLKKVAREEDTVARLGGDEFLVVLTSIKDAGEAAVAAERIVAEMDNEFVIANNSFKVSCSIGIGIFPEHGSDDETLIKNADAAMYSAKESGRYAYRFFTDAMNAEVMERLTLENSLRHALERNELFLVYQPQMHLASKQITGLEALLRWEHPELGLVPPDRFIPVAESSGLIVPIGEWVLRTACAQAQIWYTAGVPIPHVGVNVSAVQFRQEGFCELVKQVLHDSGLAPASLELELTESLLLSNADVTFSLLAELKQMGVNLAIDDFGTGYSSLSYLRQFPVSKLKIDRSFIKDVASNSDAAAITSAIIEMARALNLEVIAEGVETEAQMSFLEARRCDQIQGFYFSKPLTPDKIQETVRLTCAASVSLEERWPKEIMLEYE
jgi:diguanylate cyclase (GGDEF)-like protein/PAS domain S-box-containing protein